MKRFTFIIAALLIGSMCFAQNFEIKQAFKADKPVTEQNAEKSAWYGYSATSGYVVNVAAGTEIVLNTSTVTDKAGATITKVKFTATTHPNMPGYNGTNFEIKIYEKCEYDLITDSTAVNWATVEEALGNCVYTQPVTVELGVESEITLETPYTIPSNGKFCIALNVLANSVLSADLFELTGTATEAQINAGDYTLIAQPSYNCFIIKQGNVMYSTGWFGVSASTYQMQDVSYGLQYFIEDGQAYQESSDIEVAFGQVTLSAQGGSIDTLYANNATINLAATEDLTYALLFQNRGNDVAAANTITLTLSVNGIPINDLVYPQAVAADGWGVLTNDTLTAELMDQQQLTGTFTITFAATFSGTDPNLENNTRTITVVRSETTSIDSELSSSVSVYPNPASDMFTVANAEGSTIEVYNALGQVVTTIENASANQTIDASNLSAGAYYVKVNAQVVKMNVVK